MVSYFIFYNFDIR